MSKVDEALDKLDYIRVYLLSLGAQIEVLDYYYKPVKAYIKDQDNRIKELEDGVELCNNQAKVQHTQDMERIRKLQSQLNKIREELRNIHMDDISRKILLEILNK